jgi:hypothetical protein
MLKERARKKRRREGKVDSGERSEGDDESTSILEAKRLEAELKKGKKRRREGKEEKKKGRKRRGRTAKRTRGRTGDRRFVEGRAPAKRKNPNGENLARPRKAHTDRYGNVGEAESGADDESG